MRDTDAFASNTPVASCLPLALGDVGCAGLARQNSCLHGWPAARDAAFAPAHIVMRRMLLSVAPIRIVVDVL